MKVRPLGASVILVEPQRRLEIVPVCPDVICAATAAKCAEPKSASGRVTHWVLLRHSDGASRIHSAEVTSIAAALTVLEKLRCRERSVSVSVTRWPTTVTPALIRSPGLTVIRIGSDGAGTSSYQADETNAPEPPQSTSVPICSRAFELTLNPPSPTHIAE